MAPRRRVSLEDDDAVSTTHHKLTSIPDSEEMQATHREPSGIITEDLEEEDLKEQKPTAEAKKKQEDFAATSTAAAAVDESLDIRIHEKVASIASKAYRRAAATSNVLSRDKVAGIALVKFEDLTVGEFLGKGSFSYVHEITKIESGSNDGDNDDDGDDNNNERSTVTHSNTTNSKEEEKATDPRALLTANFQRSESKTYRYAVKFLKDTVRSNPEKFAIGTVDLVVEGMFLASLSHPNIIKVRALPEGGVKCLMRPQSNKKGYFLVLDRLFDTLSERIYSKWQEEHNVVGAGCCPFLPFGAKYQQAKKEEMKYLGERLKVAFDISAALKFLHSKNIIYRDLKPENLGFDVRGDIKLFDLGLVKELLPDERRKDGNYKLSMAGTPRYMAPECGTYKPYNLSADVYSFSMLLWEIVTMRKPLEDFTYTRLKNEVFLDGYRPAITAVKNKSVRELINMGWHQNSSKRPSIDTVYDELKSEYQALLGGKVSEEQLSHDRRRSTYIPSRITTVNVSKLVRLNSMESNTGSTQ